MMSKRRTSNPALETIQVSTISIEQPVVIRQQHTGIAAWQASLFIIGEVAGSGMLSLPNAVVGTGLSGFFLITVFGIMACYVGIRLGTCWSILEERYEDCRNEVRSPFMVIADKAYGRHMRRLLNGCMDFNLFGDCVVYLLVIGSMVQDLFHPIWNVSICYWLVILAAILAPLTWFGTPKDFWGLAAAGTATVVVAGTLLIVRSIMDSGNCGNVVFPTPTIKGFSLAYGAILFGYGGAAVFPTIQNDMKNRDHFPKAASYAFVGTLGIYLPVAITGYVVYGHYNSLTSNLANTVSSGPLKVTAQVLLIAHIMFAFVIIINPLYQELEQRLSIANNFNWKRCAFRIIMVLAILFVSEMIPQFGKVMNLIGGSTSMSLSYIFPLVFYMRLVTQKNPKWKERTVSLYEKAFICIIIVAGTAGGIASTISAIWDIAQPDAFSLPCFISAPAPQYANSTGGHCHLS